GGAPGPDVGDAAASGFAEADAEGDAAGGADPLLPPPAPPGAPPPLPPLPYPAHAAATPRERTANGVARVLRFISDTSCRIESENQLPGGELLVVLLDHVEREAELRVARPLEHLDEDARAGLRGGERGERGAEVHRVVAGDRALGRLGADVEEDRIRRRDGDLGLLDVAACRVDSVGDCIGDA